MLVPATPTDSNQINQVTNLYQASPMSLCQRRGAQLLVLMDGLMNLELQSFPENMAGKWMKFHPRTAGDFLR